MHYGISCGSWCKSECKENNDYPYYIQRDWNDYFYDLMYHNTTHSGFAGNDRKCTEADRQSAYHVQCDNNFDPASVWNSTYKAGAAYSSRSENRRTGEPVQGQIGHLQTKNSDVLGMASITLEETKRKLEDMLFLAEQNVHSSYDVFLQCDRNVFQQIEKREEQVDELNKDISKFITMAFPHENTKLGSQVLNSCYTISSNIERISDHAMNIAEYYKMNKRMGLIYTEEERKEVCHLQKTCDELFEKLKHPQSDLVQWHSRIAALEQKIDDITGLYRSHMFERMKNSQCSFEGNLLLSEMLTDFERIGDHALNIADELLHVLS